jgi:hypothetical protein
MELASRASSMLCHVTRSSFADAFTTGNRFVDELDGTIEVATKIIGELKLPTGRIVACDPFTTDFASANEPLAGAAPTGVFPVEVALATYGNGDTRVACVRVRFADEPAVRWQDPGQPDQLDTAQGPTSGYGVDTGTGCFFDAAAVGAVDSDAWLAAMEATQVPTWGWHVDELATANVVMFSTGFGDGIYASYWGFDAAGRVVELVTDFRVLIGVAFERVELPLPLPRGTFRHPLLERHGVTMQVPLLSRSSATLGGTGIARIEHPDGTVLRAAQGTGPKQQHTYSWKHVPGLSHVVLAVKTGSKPLVPRPPSSRE